MKTLLFPFCCQWASLSGTVWYGTLRRSLLPRYQMGKSLLSISIALGVHDRQTCAEFAPLLRSLCFSGQRVTMVVRSSPRWQQNQQQGVSSRPEEANEVSKVWGLDSEKPARGRIFRCLFFLW
ncbi:hypothetical protein BJX65DRAFT_75363 [Aspergillus insuetus]